MRPLTVFLALLILAALGLVAWVVHRATQDTREWKELLALEKKADFWLSTPETPARMAELFAKRVPGRAASAIPLCVLSLDESRVLLIDRVEDTTPVLVGRLSVAVLDHHRRLLRQSDLFAGFKIDRFLIHATTKGGLGPGSFEIEVGRGFRDPASTHEIFVLRNEVPVLVRVEDDTGHLEQVEYERVPNTIGGPLPDRSPEEWERSLSSPDLVEILRTLVWLGGHHCDLDDPPSKYGEPAAATRLHQETKARPGVRSKLAEFAKHPHPWVAEAARQ